MKFQKKPVVVEAVHVAEVINRTWNEPAIAEWVAAAIRSGMITVYTDCIVVRTSEGNMKGQIDDWLVQGTRGELYPCKPDAFKDTFEEVTE